MTFFFSQAVECRGNKYIDMLFYDDGSCTIELECRIPLSEPICGVFIDRENQAKLVELLTAHAEDGNPGLTKIIMKRFADENAVKGKQ